MRTISGLIVFALGVYLIQLPQNAPAAPVETVTLPAFVEPAPAATIVVEPAIVQNTAKPVNQEAFCINGQCSIPQATKTIVQGTNKVVQSVLVRPVKQVTRAVKARPRLFSGRLFRRLRCGG
jgi:hypothetical protein